jgi:hypothetical protein
MGVPRSVTRALAGVLAAPVVLLAACGGGDTSIADPPISPHPTTSSPTQQPHRESPEHFIRRWAAAEKRMENTGKTGPYLAMSQGCESCTQLANDVSNFYSAGGYVRWDGWQIVSIKHYADHGHRRAFAMRARAGATQYKESTSGELQTLAGGLATDVVALARTDTSWRVVGFTKLGS